MEPSLAPEIESLSFLLGTWIGEGEGMYPTVHPFRYQETLVFSHVGKPFLAYQQRTRNLETGLPSHAEVGYWRQPAPGQIELVLAHPPGITEIAVGTAIGQQIELASTSVVGTPTAKSVTALERSYEVAGDVLRYTIRMAAVGQPLQGHLTGELHRQPPA